MRGSASLGCRLKSRLAKPDATECKGGPGRGAHFLAAPSSSHLHPAVPGTGWDQGPFGPEDWDGCKRGLLTLGSRGHRPGVQGPEEMWGNRPFHTRLRDEESFALWRRITGEKFGGSVNLGGFWRDIEKEDEEMPFCLRKGKSRETQDYYFEDKWINRKRESCDVFRRKKNSAWWSWENSFINVNFANIFRSHAWLTKTNGPKSNCKHQGYIYTQKSSRLSASGGEKIKSIKQFFKCQVPALPECFSFHLFWHFVDTARKDYNRKISFQDVILVTGTEKKDRSFPRLSSVDGCPWFLTSLSEVARGPGQVQLSMFILKCFQKTLFYQMASKNMARNNWGHLFYVCIILFQQRNSLWELG